MDIIIAYKGQVNGQNSYIGYIDSGGQWRIEDFLEKGQPRGGGINLLFGKKIAENCMKMKEIGPVGGCAS